jgi:hypothetical protein
MGAPPQEDALQGGKTLPLRQAEQRLQRRRREEGPGDGARSQDLRQFLGTREGGEQRHRAAVQEVGEDVVPRGREGEGAAGQEAAVRNDRAGLPLQPEPVQVALVAEADGLRLARRARGQRQQRRVAQSPRARAQPGGQIALQPQQSIEGESRVNSLSRRLPLLQDQREPQALHDAPALLRAGPEIQGNRRRVEPPESQDRRDHLQAPPQGEADALAGFDARAVEARRQGLGPLQKLDVREAL